jgi:serine/threonine protein kinase
MNEDFKYVCLPKGTMLKSVYEVKEHIHISDLSIVYLGFDHSRGKDCVIKEHYPQRLILRDLDQKTVCCRRASGKKRYLHSREMFLNEADILRLYRHKRAASYIDHFIDNNTGYIVVEYCKGETLDRYMEKEKAFALSIFLKDVFIPLLDAVGALHKKGIIHRDIKPNNIIIDDTGAPVIIDFGSAVHYKKTDNKKIFVTPGFSPIEFYSERSKQGKHSDIYSLAATLYYYLSGKAPLEASARVIEDSIEDISEYNCIISGLLSKTIMMGLSINSKMRLPSLRLFRLVVYLEYLRLRLKRVG